MKTLQVLPFLSLVSLLSLAAPPTHEQIHAAQLQAFANATLTTADRRLEETTRPAPRGKRDAPPCGHSKEKKFKKVRRHGSHGHEKRIRGIGEGSHDKRQAGRLVKRGDDDGGNSTADSDVEPRAATQYPLPGNTWTTSATSAAAVASSGGSSTKLVQPSGLGSYWSGVSSYYLHAIVQSDRVQILDAVQAAGFKVVRIFIASVGANNKGSNSIAVNDLEPNQIGVYDDTILTLVDQLMVECYARGLKLLIALDDRYALGFWSTNAYALSLNIVKAGTSGVQKISDASMFYTSSSAIASFDKRLTHILNHQNALMGGKKWSELEEVIYAFEPQNEPQGHMDMVSSSWVCGRAAVLKSLIPDGSSILVSSGGGITTTISLGDWATGCSNIDVVSVHDYGTNAGVTVGTLVNAQQKLKSSGKTVILGEWGIAGTNKVNGILSFVNALKSAGMPWMYWEIVKPGQGSSDFEVWTNEPAWAALTGGNPATYVTTPPAATSTTPAWVAKPSSTTSSKTPSPTATVYVSSTSWTPAPTTTSQKQQQQQWTTTTTTQGKGEKSRSNAVAAKASSSSSSAASASPDSDWNKRRQ